MSVDLDRLRRLYERRTDGRWEWDPRTKTIDAYQDEETHVVTVAIAHHNGIDIDEDDAELIVSVVNALPQLLAVAGLARRIARHRRPGYAFCAIDDVDDALGELDALLSTPNK